MGLGDVWRFVDHLPCLLTGKLSVWMVECQVV